MDHKDLPLFSWQDRKDLQSPFLGHTDLQGRMDWRPFSLQGHKGLLLPSWGRKDFFAPHPLDLTAFQQNAPMVPE
mgnify:CR=1 FL=1